MTRTPPPDNYWKTLTTRFTGATEACYSESVQSLWSGFGEIFRAKLTGAQSNTIIIKHVAPPTDITHPRGWDSSFATRRKLKSYEVESAWYQHWSSKCTTNCRVADCYGTDQQEQQHWILLEDLDAAGYALRYSKLDTAQAAICLDWLAHFHALFLNAEPHGLWDTGTYWHLDTRPDEFQTMTAGPLRDHAATIDALLRDAKYQTLVHGDAKVANFCFHANTSVAAVDFQYVGRGCGMQDVAYFISSCLSEQQCEQYADQLLDRYFSTLKTALEIRANDRDAMKWDFSELESEWRTLYPVAWTDFYRFLLGWMPTHQKIHRYTEALAEQTLLLISSGGVD